MSKQSFTTGQVLTAAQVNSLQANDYNQTVSVKTASYVLVAADKGTRIEFNTSGSVTCTVNSGLFDAGDTLVIQNRGTGAATVTAGTATVNTSASLVVKQYDSGVLYFVSDSSAIYFASDAADTPLTTKGDLFTFSTAADRLAVGNPGETLVADSSATTGLRWQGDYAAGKNKFINGDFNINQRAFSSSTTSGTYLYDRFFQNNSGGTATYSAQTFTTGAAPVAGYEGKNYLRIVTSGQTTGNYALVQQNIESVRTLAGQTATFSFWAKAGSGTPNINVRLRQNFGTGGSPSSAVSTLGTVQTITTSWARYSFTISVPSISGKTLGTANDDSFNASIIVSDDTFLSSGVGIQNGTFELWGFQMEAGSVATAFQTATGTLAGELAACQRYFQQIVKGNSLVIANGFYLNANQVRGVLPYLVSMRTAPTLVQTTGTNFYIFNNGSDDFLNSLTLAFTSNNNTLIYNNTEASGTTQTPGVFITNDATSSIALSAEL